MKLQKLLFSGFAGFGFLAFIAYLTTDNVASAQNRYQNNFDGIAWCWKNSSGYYFCYGPTQIVNAGDRNLDKQLDYAGCKGPQLQSYPISGSGVCNGAMLLCTQTKMWGYHNQPKRIRNWVRDKGC